MNHLIPSCPRRRSGMHTYFAAAPTDVLVCSISSSTKREGNRPGWARSGQPRLRRCDGWRGLDQRRDALKSVPLKIDHSHDHAVVRIERQVFKPKPPIKRTHFVIEWMSQNPKASYVL